MHVDVVVVAVPNAIHADATTAALEAGKHVLLEKPLAHTLEDATRIRDAAVAAQSQAMVGFMLPFDPASELVRRRIDRGDMGQIYDIDAEMVRRRGIPQIGSWFTRKDVSGGGVLIDIGSHISHLALTLSDFPAIESVDASVGTHFGDRSDYTYHDMWGGDPLEDPTFDVEDHARAFIRTEGPTIDIQCAWAANRQPSRSVTVQGADAGVSFEPGADPAVYGTDGDSLTSTAHDVPEGEPKCREWEYFLDVLAGDRPHDRNTVEEGYLVQQLLDAIYRSADSGDAVSLRTPELAKQTH
jgi:predicted dehydrogenase